MCYVLFVKRSGVVLAGMVKDISFDFVVLNTGHSGDNGERHTENRRRERGDVLLSLRGTEGLWFS